MSKPQNSVIIEPSSLHKASIIWLHGLGADGHDFEPIVPELNLPDSAGIRFIFPHAPVRPVTINGGMSMRAWYDIRDVDLRKMEDIDSIEDSAVIINNLIASEISSGIPSEEILLAGFSQGGAMILHAGLRYPEKLAGLLVLSAYLPVPDRLLAEAHEVNKSTPVLMCHGKFDPVVPEFAGQQSCEYLQKLGYQVQWQSYPMQHTICLEEVQYISKWLRKIFK